MPAFNASLAGALGVFTVFEHLGLNDVIIGAIKMIFNPKVLFATAMADPNLRKMVKNFSKSLKENAMDAINPDSWLPHLSKVNLEKFLPNSQSKCLL